MSVASCRWDVRLALETASPENLSEHSRATTVCRDRVETRRLDSPALRVVAPGDDVGVCSPRAGAHCRTRRVHSEAARWSSSVARQAHNLEVASSNLARATAGLSQAAADASLLHDEAPSIAWNPVEGASVFDATSALSPARQRSR